MRKLLILLVLSIPALAQIPGYNVPSSGVGLTVCIGPGSNTLSGSVVNYAGSCIGPLTLNSTTFGYLASSGTLTTNTTGAPSGGCPIFEADTNQFQVTAVRDKRPSVCGGGGGVAFSLLAYGGVADNSTDNCTALTNFAAAINAYSGPGIPTGIISMPVGGVAYKTTCGFQLTIPATITGGGVLNCKNTSGACILIGANGLAAFATKPNYTIQNLYFIGGDVGASSAITINPFIANTIIEGNVWYNFGTSSNWAIIALSPDESITISRNTYWNDDATTGRNFFQNLETTSQHSDTAIVTNNWLIAAGNTATTGPCGGVGVYIEGFSSAIVKNAFYGFGAQIILSNTNLDGALIDGNSFDDAGCSRSGVRAAIQFGDTSHTGNTNGVTITNNTQNGFDTAFIGLAGDTTAVTLNYLLVAQNTSLLQASPLFNTNLTTCGVMCSLRDNKNFSNTGVGGGSNFTMSIADDFYRRFNAAYNASVFDLGLWAPQGSQAATLLRFGFLTPGTTSAPTDSICPWMYSKGDGTNPGQIYCDFANSAGGGFFLRERDTSSGATTPRLNITKGGDTIFNNGSGNEVWKNDSGASINFGVTRTNGIAQCEAAGSGTLLNTGSTTTDTGQNCLPANAIIDSLVYNIGVTITTAANFTIGDATTAARFCSTQSTLTAGTTGICFVQADQTGAAGPRQVTAAKVRVTTNVNPGAGRIRMFVFYHTWTAPTS